ncbi:hypothetical protein PG985_011788 [Apiospora marii]|uniref:Uncharacterized protein n=1 Tax=Apiospora marii TaxID=335849 RepID=A0ABR1R0U5_9PEZI
MASKMSNASAQPGPKPPNLRAMRLYHRYRKCWAILDSILSASAAFAALPAEKQALIRDTCTEAITENLDDLEDHMPRRTMYDYDGAVLAAVKSAVYWNPDVLAWNEDDWAIPAENDKDENEDEDEDHGIPKCHGHLLGPQLP